MKIEMFDTLLEAVVIIDDDQFICYANDAFSTLVEIPLRRILKKKKLSQIAIFDIKALKENSELVKVDGPTPYEETEFTTSYDKKGKVQISIQKYAENQEENKWILFFRDVTLEETLQKKYRSELSQKEDLIANLQDKLFETEFRYKLDTLANLEMDYDSLLIKIMELFKEMFDVQVVNVLTKKDEFQTEYIDPEDNRKNIPLVFNELVDELGESPCIVNTKNAVLQSFLDSHNSLDNSIWCVPLKDRKQYRGYVFIYGLNKGTKKLKEVLSPISKYMVFIFDNLKWYERSITDDMTEMYNFRFLKRCLTRELSLAERYERVMSFIILDIDHFKKFNDSYGHQTGDQVLKAVANILKSCCRDSDFAARYGGEEFSFILPMTDTEGAVLVAERVRKKIEAYSLETENYGSLKITISLGVSSYPAHGLDEETLVKNADTALYVAKENGRNQVRVHIPKELKKVSND